MFFKDRHEAGLRLAEKLGGYRGQPDSVVLGLARGGVVVAHAVAQALHLPLDVVVIRKVGAPQNEELAIGAVDEEGEGVFNSGIIKELGISPAYVASAVENQKKIARERAALYRGGGRRIDAKGKTVIIVDDGIATGASMKAALHALKKKGVKKMILAVPVAAPESLQSIRGQVDDAVCLYAPEGFMAVGQFYQDFDQTSDAEVMRLLK